MLYIKQFSPAFPLLANDGAGGISLSPSGQHLLRERARIMERAEQAYRVLPGVGAHHLRGARLLMQQAKLLRWLCDNQLLPERAKATTAAAVNFADGDIVDDGRVSVASNRLSLAPTHYRKFVDVLVSVLHNESKDENNPTWDTFIDATTWYPPSMTTLIDLMNVFGVNDLRKHMLVMYWLRDQAERIGDETKVDALCKSYWLNFALDVTPPPSRDELLTVTGDATDRAALIPDFVKHYWKVEVDFLCTQNHCSLLCSATTDLSRVTLSIRGSRH